HPNIHQSSTFFFYGSAAHRDVHSFPTRRSSDLYFSQGGDLFDATRKAAADLRGAYAIGVVALSRPDIMSGARMGCPLVVGLGEEDRKSTRLNSSHDQISYAVFCLKKKTLEYVAR